VSGDRQSEIPEFRVMLHLTPTLMFIGATKDTMFLHSVPRTAALMAVHSNTGARANTGVCTYLGFYGAQTIFYVCALIFFLNFYM